MIRFRPVQTIKLLSPSLLLLALLALSAATFAQRKIEYEISFPNAVHHEAEINVVWQKLPVNKPLELRMSRSSPGRYAVHEFARNVYNVRATDEKGTPLTITRPNAYQWNISGHRGTVRVMYTLYGDYASGTYTGIDNTMAHLNIPATFLWARGLEQTPIQVRFRLPDPNWKVATQLVPTAEPEIFTAPNLQYFMDSPALLGKLRIRDWPLQSNGKTYTMRLALNDLCPDKDVDTFVEMLKKIVAEQVAIFGEAPDFDFGTYTFLANYSPQVDGDGMEHRNSTSLTSTRSLQGSPRGNLGTASHEFFHAWNVERLRPRALEPFNFEEPNLAGELWLAEGFTQYYGNLVMQRAGFVTDVGVYGRGLGFTINAILNTPGRKLHSAVDMSLRAVFEDGGVSAAPTNSQNLFLSYYAYGSAVALGLDLTLRTKFPGKSLDDYMRALWQAFGRQQKNYAPVRPYTLADLQAVLAQVTGDEAFAKDYFARYIYGREVVDYASLLAKAGYILRPARPDAVWLDANLREQNGTVVISAPTSWTGAFYQAGLDRGDKLLTVDGQAVKKPAEVQALFQKHKPGDVIPLEFEQRGVKKSTQLTCLADPQIEVVTVESLKQELTESMQRFRTQWLGPRVVAR